MACLLLDGQVYTIASALEDHPNGACTMIPIVDGVDEPSWEYGRNYFMGLSPEEQEARMGSSYYKAWKAGDIKLSDMVGIKENGKWGNNPYVKPLSALVP